MRFYRHLAEETFFVTSSAHEVCCIQLQSGFGSAAVLYASRTVLPNIWNHMVLVEMCVGEALRLLGSHQKNRNLNLGTLGHGRKRVPGIVHKYRKGTSRPNIFCMLYFVLTSHDANCQR